MCERTCWEILQKFKARAIGTLERPRNHIQKKIKAFVLQGEGGLGPSNREADKVKDRDDLDAMMRLLRHREVK